MSTEQFVGMVLTAALSGLIGAGGLVKLLMSAHKSAMQAAFCTLEQKQQMEKDALELSHVVRNNRQVIDTLRLKVAELESEQRAINLRVTDQIVKPLERMERNFDKFFDEFQKIAVVVAQHNIEIASLKSFVDLPNRRITD